MLILSLKGCKEKRPAIVFLHSTNKCKEWLRPLLEVQSYSTPMDFLCLLSVYKLPFLGKTSLYLFVCLFQAYASRGYIAIAIDSRYHGERASSNTTYRDVSIRYCYLF